MASLSKELQEYGQEHMLNFWPELSEEERDFLKNDLSGLDLAEVTSYYSEAMSCFLQIERNMLDDRIQPIPESKIASEKTCSEEELEGYESLGLLEIARGRCAVLLLGGGQGTRLGVSYPKGMYDVELPSRKTLFQLQAERILRLQTLAREAHDMAGEITWYVMISEATYDATIAYFERNDYFGLKKENAIFFKQGMLPCFTLEGKVILDEKYKISKAPNGNGGLYKALKTEGILEDMKERGIRSVHVHSVDNILIKVADPIFIGYCLSNSADCGVKVIEKSIPSEQVGVICKVDQNYRVVEYSEITRETSELRRDDGRLVYNAANICNHYFTFEFLAMISNDYETSMELHAAKKKIPYINDRGERCNPTSPNGIKIEKFIFDVFPFAKNFVAWEGPREREFSPLKNSDSVGQDCPATARRDLLKLHKRWLLDAGAAAVNGDVEISPLRSYAGENLSTVKGVSFEGPSVLEHI